MPRGVFRQHHRIKPVREIARRLRRQSTRSEELLWQALRNRQLDGMKFLRQHPIGSSIVDFYCHEKRLVVEVDGPIHRNEDVEQRDRERQELIEKYDIRFYCCTSEAVVQDLSRVLEEIRGAVQEVEGTG